MRRQNDNSSGWCMSGWEVRVILCKIPWLKGRVTIGYFKFQAHWCAIFVTARSTHTVIHLKYNWLLKGIVGYKIRFRVYLCMKDWEEQFEMCVGPLLRFCEFVAVNCKTSILHVDYFNSLWHFNPIYPYTNDNIQIMYQQVDNLLNNIYVGRDTPVNLKVRIVMFYMEYHLSLLWWFFVKLMFC